MLSLRLSKEMEQKLETMSKQTKMSKSDMVREAIEQYLVEREVQMEPALLDSVLSSGVKWLRSNLSQFNISGFNKQLAIYSTV